MLGGSDYDSQDGTRWLPKANIQVSPFSAEGPLPVDLEGLRNLELFGNFGIGYHSNDARPILSGASNEALPRALGGEVGVRTRFLGHVDLAVDVFYLNIEEELLFVGDEGTTEPVGETERVGVEAATTIWLHEGWYARADIAYTSARLVDEDVPLPQAPRFIAKAATGVRYEGLAAELALRHLGERYATDDPTLGFPQQRLSDYTVLDFSLRYRFGFLELGFAIENLTDTDWSSSEFFYESRPDPAGPTIDDNHLSPGNPRNVRAWVTGYF